MPGGLSVGCQPVVAESLVIAQWSCKPVLSHGIDIVAVKGLEVDQLPIVIEKEPGADGYTRIFFWYRLFSMG